MFSNRFLEQLLILIVHCHTHAFDTTKGKITMLQLRHMKPCSVAQSSQAIPMTSTGDELVAFHCSSPVVRSARVWCWPMNPQFETQSIFQINPSLGVGWGGGAVSSLVNIKLIACCSLLVSHIPPVCCGLKCFQLTQYSMPSSTFTFKSTHQELVATVGSLLSANKQLVSYMQVSLPKGSIGRTCSSTCKTCTYRHE